MSIYGVSPPIWANHRPAISKRDSNKVFGLLRKVKCCRCELRHARSKNRLPYFERQTTDNLILIHGNDFRQLGGSK